MKDDGHSTVRQDISRVLAGRAQIKQFF